MRGVRAAGFTLVELVTVMAILGILSIGTVFYLRDASSGFAGTVARDDLVGTGRFALQRIAAEVRDALPTSVRTTGQCLEYLPVAAATHYLNLPTAPALWALDHATDTFVELSRRLDHATTFQHGDWGEGTVADGLRWLAHEYRHHQLDVRARAR